MMLPVLGTAAIAPSHATDGTSTEQAQERRNSSLIEQKTARKRFGKSDLWNVQHSSPILLSSNLFPVEETGRNAKAGS